MDTPDTDLAVHDVLSGNRERFGVIVQAYHVPVRALITALVRDPNDADDLAQQTFIFALKNLHEYLPGTNMLAWLKAIARNHVISFQRRISQRSVATRTYLLQEVTRLAAERAASDRLEDRIDALQQCMSRLPDHQQSFLRAVLSRSSTLEDLAQKLGKTAISVRRNLSRLYSTLRECVEVRLGGPEAPSA